MFERFSKTQQRGPVDPDSEMTLLHELGHHVSKQAGTPHSAYNTPSKQGREEGFADAYMMSHFRDDPRTVRWRGRSDPREHSYLARGQTRERFGPSGAIDYAAELGSQNRPPKRMGLNIMGGEGAATEQTHRPMLDEHLPEHQQVFTQPLEGWSRAHNSPEEQREGLYSKAAQTTNMRRQVGMKGKQELKRRWGVNRNLGPQWKGSGESPET